VQCVPGTSSLEIFTTKTKKCARRPCWLHAVVRCALCARAVVRARRAPRAGGAAANQVAAPLGARPCPAGGAGRKNGGVAGLQVGALGVPTLRAKRAETYAYPDVCSWAQNLRHRPIEVHEAGRIRPSSGGKGEHVRWCTGLWSPGCWNTKHRAGGWGVQGCRGAGG
jgi:hypothetical protein